MFRTHNDPSPRLSDYVWLLYANLASGKQLGPLKRVPCFWTLKGDTRLWNALPCVLFPPRPLTAGTRMIRRSVTQRLRKPETTG